MKKLFSILTILLLMMFSLTACKIETASQHDARLAAESESLAEEQESLLSAQNNEVADGSETQTLTNVAETELNSSVNSSSTQVNGNATSSSGTLTSTGSTAGSTSVSSPTAGSVAGNTGSSNTTSQPTTPSTITVKLLITCHNITQYASENSNINPSGIIYENTLVLPVGSKVLTALENSGVPFIKSSNYISSINNIAEKWYGDKCGWMYKVNNGNPPPVTADSYTLKGGETIEFYYVTDTTDK